MEKIRYRPVKDMVVYPALLEDDCKALYLNGEIDDNWIVEIHIPDEDTLHEIPSTLWNR